MGFEGTVVTPQIRKLIAEHHIGSILLTAKNLKCTSSISPWTQLRLTVCANLAQLPNRRRN